MPSISTTIFSNFVFRVAFDSAYSAQAVRLQGQTCCNGPEPEKVNESSEIVVTQRNVQQTNYSRDSHMQSDLHEDDLVNDVEDFYTYAMGEEKPKIRKEENDSGKLIGSCEDLLAGCDVMGEGAYGKVYKVAADHARKMISGMSIPDQRHVAIKVQKKTPDVVKEIVIMQKLSADEEAREVTPKFFGSFEDGDNIGIVMELIEDKKDMFAAMQELGTAKFLEVLLSALRKFHKAGYVHHDLAKFDNIWWTKNGMRILDFGTVQQISHPFARDWARQAADVSAFIPLLKCCGDYEDAIKKYYLDITAESSDNAAHWDELDNFLDP